MNETARRVLMTVAGVVLCGLAAGMMAFVSFGVDPFQVFSRGVWGLTGIDFGTFYVILCAVMLLVVFFWNRRMIGLGTIINLFGIGYLIEFAQRMLQGLFPAPGLGLRVVLMIVALVAICFASALYFTADMGVSTYDAIALTLAERQKRLPFKYCRVLCDIACVLIGFLLRVAPGMIGVGTIITAFFMGPLVAFFNRTVAEPMRYGGGGKLNGSKDRRDKA